MWGMMQGYGLGGGMGLGMAGGILLWGLMVVGIVVLARWILDRLGGGETAMQILDKRYARGEISREEYEKMKREVGGGGPPVLS